jgi:hypothetical protein
MKSSHERSIAGVLVLLLVSSVASAASPLNRLDFPDSTGEGTIRSIGRIGHLAYVTASAKQETRLTIGARDEVPPGEMPDTSRSEADASSIRRLDPAYSPRQGPVLYRAVAGRAPPLPGSLS